MSLWLLLKTPDQRGCALQLHPAPLEQGRPPRPFSRGAEGEKFTDFQLYWLADPSKHDPATGKPNWREPLDGNDALQRSANKSGALAYRLLYHHIENPIRHQFTVRYQLAETELTAQKGSKNITGESGDLLFALAVVTTLLPRAGGYTPLAATGALDKEGRVKWVDGVPEKLRAYLSVVAELPPIGPSATPDEEPPPKALFFYPRANDDTLNSELRQAAKQAGVRLIAVERLDEAMRELKIEVKNSWRGNPYRGFGVFGTADQPIFFGRKSDSLAVCRELLKRENEGNPGILVIGSSGRGKSSLVCAGVIPDLLRGMVAFDESDPQADLLERPIFYHVWRFPQDAAKGDAAQSEAALVQALRLAWAHLPIAVDDARTLLPSSDLAGDPTLAALADELADALPSHRRFVWVIDQMEELFSLQFPDATVEAFGAFLQRLQGLGVWPIATLRSEYFHDYQNSNLLAVFGNGHALPKMHETALGHAIRDPAKLAKLEFETDPATGINLADHIRDEVLRGGDDMLPLLGFLLSELYEDQERVSLNDGRLTWAAYRRLGGLTSANPVQPERLPVGKSGGQPGSVSRWLSRIGLRGKGKPAPSQPLAMDKPFEIGGLAGAVGAYADKLLLEKCSSEERDALPKVLLHLVRLSEDGKQALRQRARLKAFEADPHQASLVRTLIDERLLISHADAETQEATVELVHDCLLAAWDKVGAAIEQHRELLEEKRKLSNAANHWVRSGRPERLLLSRSREVLQAEMLIACSSNDLRDTKTQDFITESIRFTRTGFRIFWLLLCMICILGTLFDFFITYENSSIFEKLLRTIPINLILSPIWLKAFRSIAIKSYISTLHSELIFCYFYIFVSFIFIIFITFKTISSNGVMSIILFPIILAILIIYIKRIIFNKKQLKALKNRFPAYNFSPKYSIFIGLVSPTIWTWRKLEIVFWIFLFFIAIMSWLKWQEAASLTQKYKAQSIEHISQLQLMTAKHFAAGNIKDAQVNIEYVDNILSFYNDEFLCTSETNRNFLLRNNISTFCYEEDLALASMQLELNRCLLKLINAEHLSKFFPSFWNGMSLTQCTVSIIKQSRLWIKLSASKTNAWKNQLEKCRSYTGFLTLYYAENFLKSLPVFQPFHKELLKNALQFQQEAKHGFEELLLMEPQSISYKYNLAIALKQIGEIHQEDKKKDLALEYYGRAKDILESLSNISSEEFDISWDLIDLYGRMAVVCRYDFELFEVVDSMESLFENKIRNQKESANYQSAQIAIQKLLNKDIYAISFIAFSRFEILRHRHDKSLNFAEAAITIYPEKSWSQLQFAHALLFMGRYEEAKAIYIKNPMQRMHSDTTFRQQVLEDFQDFRKAGVKHPDMEKIEELYNRL